MVLDGNSVSNHTCGQWLQEVHLLRLDHEAAQDVHDYDE